MTVSMNGGVLFHTCDPSMFCPSCVPLILGNSLIFMGPLGRSCVRGTGGLEPALCFFVLVLLEAPRVGRTLAGGEGLGLV